VIKKLEPVSVTPVIASIIPALIVEIPALTFKVTRDPLVAKDWPFNPDFMMGEHRDAVPAQALDHKPAMVESIPIGNETLPENKINPVMRQQEPMQIMLPKVVKGDKRESCGVQTEIQIHPHASVECQTDPRPEHRARRQRRPTAIAF